MARRLLAMVFCHVTSAVGSCGVVSLLPSRIHTALLTQMYDGRHFKTMPCAHQAAAPSHSLLSKALQVGGLGSTHTALGIRRNGATPAGHDQASGSGLPPVQNYLVRWFPLLPVDFSSSLLDRPPRGPAAPAHGRPVGMTGLPGHQSRFVCSSIGLPQTFSSSSSSSASSHSRRRPRRGFLKPAVP